MLRRARGLPILTLAISGIVLAAIAASAAAAVLYSSTPLAAPAVDEVRARAIAVNTISSFQPPAPALPVTGWAITSDRYEIHGNSVIDSGGKVVATEEGSFCFLPHSCGATPVWEVELAAPAQNGWKTIKAIVVVDATTGRVRSTSVAQSN